MKLFTKTNKNIFILCITIWWASIFWMAQAPFGFDFGSAVEMTGNMGWILLSFTILVSLFQKLVGLWWPKFSLLKQLLPFRKYTGVFSFLVVGSHGLTELLSRNLGMSFGEYLRNAFSINNAEIFGSMAFLVMLPIFLTSTTWAIKKLGPKLWKKIQQLAHIAFVFAALHVALIEYFKYAEIEAFPIVLLVIYFVGYGYLYIHKNYLSSKK